MASASSHILLFGGTTEGRRLACDLVDRGWRVTVCVATDVGARQYPEDLSGLDLHIGRLDFDEMTSLMGQGFSCVLDATHPYAVEVSRNVRSAAERVGLAYIRVIRPRVDFSGCLVAQTVEEACREVPADGGCVLAATGNKEIADYTVIEDYRKRVFARVLPDEASVESCRAIGLSDDHIITGTGPFSVADNESLMRAHDISYLITKESGQAGGFPEKLEAAHACGCTVIVVCRPQHEAGLLPEEALERIGYAPDSGTGVRAMDGEERRS